MYMVPGKVVSSGMLEESKWNARAGIFSITNNVVIDNMHDTLLGITKNYSEALV